MKAVIFNPPQRDNKIERLVDYIYRLSKVTVEVIDIAKDKTWLNLFGKQNESFRYVASKVSSPFVLLESDSIPLTEDWLDELNERWNECEKGTIALVSTDFQSPHNMSSRIGVYSPTIHSHIPQGLMTHRFDNYITEFRDTYIERTGLIQQSNGFYNDRGNLKIHKFPEDNWILRETSVIFHSDKEQSLITQYDTPEQEEILTP